jgi:rhomboid-like protein
LIINGLFYLATLVFLFTYNIDLQHYLSLYQVQSPYFRPYQFITHMFMHATYADGNIVIFHILFNMYALWMFGAPLENYWGPKRFLIFYMACGLGAAVLYLIFLAFTHAALESSMLGASGAVFGVLTAYAVLFPNSELIIIPIPIPVKAKYLVVAYVGYELYSGIQNAAGDNVAHFAHLGGALVGFILVKIWQRDRTHFY